MDTNSTSASVLSTVPVPTSPRSMGRPTAYSEEMVGRLCEVIRRRGLSDGAAALNLGIPRSTLTRWKQEHAELKDWLAMAREQYREAKLGLVDEAKTADGRPDWRAAARALQKAFPKDYGRPGRGLPRQSYEPSAAAGLGALVEAGLCGDRAEI